MSVQNLNDLRARVLAGETIPPEELAAAIKALRANRVTASVTSTTSRKAKTQTPEDSAAELDDLLSGVL